MLSAGGRIGRSLRDWRAATVEGENGDHPNDHEQEREPAPRDGKSDNQPFGRIRAYRGLA